MYLINMTDIAQMHDDEFNVKVKIEEIFIFQPECSILLICYWDESGQKCKILA